MPFPCLTKDRAVPKGVLREGAFGRKVSGAFEESQLKGHAVVSPVIPTRWQRLKLLKWKGPKKKVAASICIAERNELFCDDTNLKGNGGLQAE